MSGPALPGRSPLFERWALDPATVFLNHGSFGACPRTVLEAQAALRAELEANPVALLGRALDARLAAVRARLGAFLGADPDDLAFMPNATHGIATVLRSLPAAAGWGAGDEVVVTDHEYRAAINAVVVTAEALGVRVVTARIPYPLPADAAAAEAVAADAVLDVVTPRTRLVLISHVTSPTAIRLPVERLVPALEARGVPVLVDGAHAPGMLPLALDALGASFYTGNLHKWPCAPKGAAFLHVRRDRQAAIRPLAISHAASDPRPSPPAPSRFRREFDWTGTDDPTPLLAVPAALDAVAALHADGWPGVMAANHALAVRGRELVLDALGSAFGPAWGGVGPAGRNPLAPAGLLGSMATVALPMPPDWRAPAHGEEDPLAGALRDRHAIEIPVFGWPLPGPDEPPARRLARLSAHLHNAEDEYRHLGAALVEELRREGVR